MSEVVTVAQAAAIIGVTARRVLQFIAQKRLPARQVNPRLWLVKSSDARTFARKKRPNGKRNP